MENKELLFKALCSYLPYDPKIKFTDSDNIFGITFESTPQWDDTLYPMATLKFTLELSRTIGWGLLLRPLSQLTKEIDHNGEKFVPIERLYEMFGGGYSSINSFTISNLNDFTIPRLLNYSRHSTLLEWHFDCFGLIEEGLAIDINTVKSSAV